MTPSSGFETIVTYAGGFNDKIVEARVATTATTQARRLRRLWEEDRLRLLHPPALAKALVMAGRKLGPDIGSEFRRRAMF
jgi:hypothetical protein